MPQTPSPCWFEAGEPFTFRSPKATLFLLAIHKRYWTSLILTIPPASKMQLAPAAVATGINSREHCGFAIKLLSAISKFIVLIVFPWPLCAHVLLRWCPDSLAPAIVFQCDRCLSLQTVKPHFSWQIKTANKISFLICMRSCRTHQMRIKGGKVRSPQANPGDLCYGYASLIAESLSLLLWKGHWIWNWKNRRKSWLCYILSASP